jgi:hypothetical protein
VRALVYGVPPEPLQAPASEEPLVQNLARSPTVLKEVPDPVLLRGIG